MDTTTTGDTDMDTKTADAHREKAKAAEQDAIDSFDRCDTDGFLSQWASGLTAQKHRMQADIIDNGGVSEFRGLFDRETGERIAAKLIDGQYGLCWAFCDEEGQFTGRFLGDSKGTKQSRMYREGFEVQYEMAPAKADIRGSGRGLSGSAWACVVRTDGGFPLGSKVVG